MWTLPHVGEGAEGGLESSPWQAFVGLIPSVGISVQNDDFVVELGSAHRLNDGARRRFLLQYEERKQMEFKHPIFGYRMTYQRCFELQVRLLAKYLQHELDKYPPLLTK